MDSPRSGRLRAAAASWALVGIGVGTVGVTSTLAYAGTLQPPAAQTPAADLPAPPDVSTTTSYPTTPRTSPSYSPHVTVSRGS